MLREPIDLPPIVSVELIQITDKTSIPYAPRQENYRGKQKRGGKIISEQAPPAAKAKENLTEFLYPMKKKRKKNN